MILVQVVVRLLNNYMNANVLFFNGVPSSVSLGPSVVLSNNCMSFA